jgi:hypothetical protein
MEYFQLVPAGVACGGSQTRAPFKTAHRPACGHLANLPLV